jgi:hypothetical protein
MILWVLRDNWTFFLILDLVYVNDVMHKLCNDNLLCEHHN